MQVNMLEAKNQLSRLVKAALKGEEVIIANNGEPLVRLVRVDAKRKRRKPGAWAHLPPPAPGWDSPELDRQIADELAGKRRG